ncbi:MAG TPA: aldo/keto reductase family oxidoreductase [Clostridiales bacterium]|nr:aldo/keto reductase family oxidoreductase [Clostridiales bacterium]
MNMIKFGSTNMQVPQIALGCMRLTDLDSQRAEKYIQSAMEFGYTFFDHADIYGDGKCEEIFSTAIHMNDDVREKVIIQSKCGIRPGIAYDFSKEHILRSVDGSLGRLKTDYLDILLLHRPDALFIPQEVAEAFDILYNSGKVKYFGVSNQNPTQIKLLQKYTSHKLQANQLQFGIGHCQMVSSGIHVNMTGTQALNNDGSVLDYCRLEDITVQAWSPFQYGFFEGVFLGSERFPLLNEVINRLANSYGVTNTAIAIAWIMRHPANIQPIVGSVNPQRLMDITKACDFMLTREEWYEIYMAAGNTLP